MILDRITRTAVNVGAYFHVRALKEIFINNTICFDRMSIRCNKKIHMFKITVVRDKWILFKL